MWNSGLPERRNSGIFSKGAVPLECADTHVPHRGLRRRLCRSRCVWGVGRWAQCCLWATLHVLSNTPWGADEVDARKDSIQPCPTAEPQWIREAPLRQGNMPLTWGRVTLTHASLLKRTVYLPDEDSRPQKFLKTSKSFGDTGGAVFQSLSG